MKGSGKTMRRTGKVDLEGSVGVYTHSSGDKYEGDWDKNRKSGKGTSFNKRRNIHL